MDIDKAIKLTFNVATLQRVNWRESPCVELSYEHMSSMVNRVDDTMSDTKKCRWLGWMQATLVAMTYPYTDLEVMKNINKECS